MEETSTPFFAVENGRIYIYVYIYIFIYSIYIYYTPFGVGLFFSCISQLVSRGFLPSNKMVGAYESLV